MLQVECGTKAKDAGVIEHNLVTGVLRDINNPVEVDAPGQGHGHDWVMNQWHIAPTASKLIAMT